jgi:large subunit GTPase 1
VLILLRLRNVQIDSCFKLVARGFSRAGQGTPDEARAARYILKDYVNAKLLFCHPPPDVDPYSFNEETRSLALQRLFGKKKAPVTRVGKDSVTHIPVDGSNSPSAQGVGRKSNALDQDFFNTAATPSLPTRPFVQGGELNGNEITRVRLYPHQNIVADDGTPLDSSQGRVVAGGRGPDKKHHKKAKRIKQRSGKGYD